MSSFRLLGAAGLAVLIAACAVESSTSGTSEDALSGVRPGMLDPTFGSGGRVTTSYGRTPFYAKGARAQGDGKLVVAGARDYSWAVARYLADGSLDPSFATDVDVVSYQRPYVGTVNAIAFAPNGQVILAGDIGGGSGEVEGVLSFRRLNADGTPDSALAPAHPTFAGMVKANEVHTREHLDGSGANATLVLDDGSIVVAGWAVQKDASTFQRTYGFELAKFGANGKLDTAFEDKADGPLVRRTPGTATAIARESSGKFLVGGNYQVAYEPNQLVVERRLADGSLDTTFGQAGRAFAPCNGGGCGVGDLIVQPDGKLLVGAWLTRDYFDNAGSHDRTELLVVRFNANGQLDPSFGLGGFFRPNVGSWGGAGGKIALQADGKIVLIGAALANGSDQQPLEPIDAGPDAAGWTVYATPDRDVALVRATTYGTLDPSFGNGGIVFTSAGRFDSASGAAISADGKLLTVVATSTDDVPLSSEADGSLSLLRYSLRSF